MMKMTPEISDLMQEAHLAEEKMYREAMGLAEDYTLSNIPWMKSNMFESILDAVGRENVAIVSMSSRDDWEGGPHSRGYVMISEAGRKTLSSNKERLVKSFVEG